MKSCILPVKVQGIEDSPLVCYALFVYSYKRMRLSLSDMLIRCDFIKSNKIPKVSLRLSQHLSLARVESNPTPRGGKM